jgi:bifunctional DNA-binding transcriptional regulator/antitoxin component of YhaV-PrlF toxin-antitoxin module
MHYLGNVAIMALAHSKLTAQCQISVATEIRKKLGVGPGSVLEWDAKDEEVIVPKAGTAHVSGCSRRIVSRRQSKAQDIGEREGKH